MDADETQLLHHLRTLVYFPMQKVESERVVNIYREFRRRSHSGDIPAT